MAILSVMACAVLQAGGAPMVAAESGVGLQWGRCPEEAAAGTAQCATLAVPMDYAAPERGEIELTVSRMAATTGSGHGVLFAGQGGPGVDALNFWSSRDSRLPALREFDRIAVQPRGLRWSTPLSCTQIVLAVVLATDRSSCEAAFPGYPATITTETLARDLEQVRRALGTDQIDFYGGSYGTAVGAVYATLFPDRVDKMVLDANVNPEWDWLEQQARGWLARESALDDLFDWIAANDEIYGLGATRAQVATEWVRQIDAQGGGWLTPSATQGATNVAVYWRNYWPNLAEGMRRYRVDPQRTEYLARLMSRFAMDKTSTWVNAAIVCNESDTRADPASMAAIGTEFASGANYFRVAAQVQRSGMMCAAWPSSTQRPHFDGSRLATRPLIVQTTADSATPAAGGPAMAAALDGTLIWVEGTDHGTFTRFNPIADQAILHYLRTGEVILNELAPASPITTPNPPTD